MNKNKIWLVFAPMAIGVFLTSCQSSRFMQDDMYFNQADAIREVREFENGRMEAKLNKNQIEDPNNVTDEVVSTNEDYYDYSYTSRLRRFNTDDNTWGYYDPYYTNYYWYNNSRTGYFGNSLYSTYTWWGPNFSSNYTTSYWGLTQQSTNTKGWSNPWRSSRNLWKTPYNQYVFNGWNNGKLDNGNLWNTGVGFTSMYYNSFDNNCYSMYNRYTHNFSALMQKNGIQRDVSQRPEINYTALRESKIVVIPAVADTNSSINTSSIGNNDNDRTTTRTVILEPDNSSNKSTTNNKTNTNSSNSNNTATTKRWDNHNADLKITPNTNKKEGNTSRSGVYSEGSRNNNYIYKGSAIPNKGSNNNGGTQNKGKDPNR